jgi:hypothetical protein
MKKITIATGMILTLLLSGCGDDNPTSSSGVSKASASIKVGSNGLTAEQGNIKYRTELENMPGSIKHLYVISPYSGQVIIYSTINGKVTSSGKRLSPLKSVSNNGDFVVPNVVDKRGVRTFTNEILQDDGTYGSSNPYIYWFDSKGIYHQHFFTGGQIIHISDQPIAIKNIIINMETQLNDND